MGDPQPQELEREKAAVRTFEEAHLDRPDGLVDSFRLWHYPKDDHWITWILFVPSGGEPYEEDGQVREIGWNRGVQTPKPELWIREAVVPAAMLRRALSRASHTALIEEHHQSPSSFPDFTEFGIEGYSRRSGWNRVQWESPVPYPFRTVAVWFSRTRGLFESCLK